MLKKSKLVLCVDRDNDLYDKAGVSGPIIGRDANLDAAIKLALADPADVDANAMMKAISVYDKLTAVHSVQVATLTGSSKLGYAADEEISEQLDKLLAQFPCESCIFISDGASDEAVLPIIQSRLKIDSVEVLVMKQAQELEKTYFVILEKLKEPYYARLIFGIPALIGILFVLARLLNWGFEVPAGIISIYLLLKALGIEDTIMKAVSSFKFSVEKLSLVVYIPALFLIGLSFWSGYHSLFSAPLAISSNPAKLFAYALRSTLQLLPWSVLLLISGKVVDILNEKKKIEIVKYGLYAVFVILSWLVLVSGANWIVNDSAPYVYFSDLVLILISTMVIGFASVTILKDIRRRIVLSLKIAGKEVLSAGGNYIGKVLGVDANVNAIAIKSALGQKVMISLDDVESVGDKIIVS